jgi:hypothetical protein
MASHEQQPKVGLNEEVAAGTHRVVYPPTERQAVAALRTHEMRCDAMRARAVPCHIDSSTRSAHAVAGAAWAQGLLSVR